MKIRHRYNFKYFWKEGFSGIFLHGFMSLAAVSVIVACLLITGSVALMAYNINLEILDLQSQSEIAIYIDDSVSREDALAMEPELSALDNVRSVTFVSREQVFEEFKESQGADSEIFEGLEGEDNPARDCYRIQLDDIARLDETVTALENVPGVANVVTSRTPPRRWCGCSGGLRCSPTGWSSPWGLYPSLSSPTPSSWACSPGATRSAS